MPTIDEIEVLTKSYAEKREALGGRLQRLRNRQDKLKRLMIRGIRSALSEFTNAHDALKIAVGDSRSLFEKPKTRVMHGIRVGFMKQKGKTTVEDEASTIALIKKLFPEQAEVLVRSKESVVKDALSQLSAKDLKRLGVSITEDADAVTIKPVDDALDDLIDALISDPEIEDARA